MCEDSYGALLKVAKRIFDERELILTDAEPAADYLIRAVIDGSYKNERYSVVPTENGVILTAVKSFPFTRHSEGF